MNSIDHLAALDPGKLAKSEQVALDHFRKKPDGRGFFAVGEILVRHHRIEEAIQVLMQGLERHPNYSVARVFLAQLFFKKHFFRESWNCLEASPSSLRTNLTAQILRLKLCVVLNFESQARSLARELAVQEFQDGEARIVIDHINIKTFAMLRRDYAEYLGWDGINQQQKQQIQRSTEVALKSKSQEDELAQENFQERVAKGFFSSPVQEIFVKRTAPDLKPGDLDELTRARLARRQGFYQTAFEIYEKLAYAAPGNELLRREFAEVRELRDAQKEIDRQTDPKMADAMDKVRTIDKKIAVLNHLLQNLEKLDVA
jgi:tetratricopeptide (TPR) repeat protein